MNQGYCDSCGEMLDGDVVLGHQRQAGRGRASTDGPVRRFHQRCFESAQEIGGAWRRVDPPDRPPATD